MEDWPADCTSKALLFERLRRAGFKPGDDAIDALFSAGLIEGTRRRIGGGNQGYYTADDAARITLYYETVRRLELGKPRPAEIAFWFASEGFYVPTDLVAEHLRTSVKAFLSALYNQLGRRASGRLMLMEPVKSAVEKSAKFVGNWVARLSSVGTTDQAISFFRGLAGLALERAVAVGTYRAALPWLRRVILAVNPEHPDIDLASRTLWDNMADGFSLFSPVGRNPLLLAIEEALQSEPDALKEAVRDARLMADLVATEFPWFSDAGRFAFGASLLSKEQATFVNRYLRPGLAATLLVKRDSATAKDFRRRLRSGDHEAILADVRLSKEMWRYVLALLEGRAPAKPPGPE